MQKLYPQIINPLQINPTLKAKKMENVQGKTPSPLNCLQSLSVLHSERHKHTKVEDNFIDLVS